MLTVLAGVGVGWLAALNTPGLIRSFLSVTTVVGVVTGGVGKLLGLGDQTDGVLDVLHPLGTVVGTVLAGYVLWRCWRRGFDPVLGLGVAIGLFVILSPVVQPWYLLWAALPLAASTAVSRYRNVTVAITVALSVMIMPSGSVIRPLIIAQAVLAAALVAAGCLVPAAPAAADPDQRVGPLADGVGQARPAPPSQRVRATNPRTRPGPTGPRHDDSTTTQRTDMTAAVQVRGLVRRYGALTAVDGLDLTVGAGTMLALLGPNGAGKTTTVEICEGFARPDGGTVRVLGLDPWADAAVLRPRMGVMLQSAGAHLSARAGEMLRLVAAGSAHPHDSDWLLDTLGLTSVVRTPVRRLSGGQAQRLSLAMALVGRPEMLFLDEPTAGLDPQARHLVWDLLRAARADGVSILLTTHLLDEAELLADQVVIVDAGRAVATARWPTWWPVTST